MTATGSVVVPRQSRTDSADFRTRVDERLRRFVDDRFLELISISPELGPVTHALREFLLTGGKRLRPAFCYWGWRGAGGAEDDPGIVTAASALELLHACCLIHDDIMDASDIRRGRPTMHRQFAALHGEQEFVGDADSFGTSVAILLGDLCLSWCDLLFDDCRRPAGAAKALFHLMRTEVIGGQYLDVLEQAASTVSIPRARKVIRYKTAKYTVERPLQLGALLADADAELVGLYSRFALPLGEAFQLRDDVLGVFGDSAETGKPTADDLRAGKHTVLIAKAHELASPAQRGELRRLLGDPLLDDIGLATLRAIILDTGALAATERMIDERLDLALRTLRSPLLAGDVRSGLTRLAAAATQRSS